MNDFVLSGFIVGILAMIFFTPYKMAVGIKKMSGKVSISERLLCAIPIVNIIIAEKEYLGKIGLCAIGTVTCVITTVFRIFQWYYMYDNVTMGLVGMIAFWAGLLFFIISNMVLTYTIINDAGAVRGLKLILLTIGFPFGQYYIGAALPNVVRNIKNEEATFKL